MTEPPGFLAADPEPVSVQESTGALIEAAETMAWTKSHLDDAKALVSTLQKQYDMIRKSTIPEMMASLGMVSSVGKGKFTTASGSTVYLRSDVYASCKIENKPSLFAWLRSHGHEPLIKEEVHHQTLKAFVKEQMEQGAELPDMVTIHTETIAVISK